MTLSQPTSTFGYFKNISHNHLIKKHFEYHFIYFKVQSFDKIFAYFTTSKKELQSFSEYFETL